LFKINKYPKECLDMGTGFSSKTAAKSYIDYANLCWCYVDVIAHTKS
jgi:hypothetical protein